MRLITKEDVRWVGTVSFAGKSFGFVVRVVSRVLQCFKYIYVACILVCLFLVWLFVSIVY